MAKITIDITKQELEDIKKVRNYFGEHDVTIFEHFAYSFLDDLYKKLNQILPEERSKQIELLEAYSLFLEKNGYMDIDWRTEEPFAIDEFLKENK